MEFKWSVSVEIKVVNSNRNLNQIQISSRSQMKKLHTQSACQISARCCQELNQPTSYPSKRSQICRTQTHSKMEQEDQYSMKQDVEECSTSSSENACSMEQESKSDKELKIQFYLKGVDWMARRHKKLKVNLETMYLAVSYLVKYLEMSSSLSDAPEPVFATLLMLAAKMNQIYLPSLNSVIRACSHSVNKQTLISMEQSIINLFGFDIAIEHNAYSRLRHALIQNKDEQINSNAQKLLFLAISQPECLEFGQDYLVASVIYLTQPGLLHNLNLERDRVKQIAFVIYQKYKERKRISKTQNSGN